MKRFLAIVLLLALVPSILLADKLHLRQQDKVYNKYDPGRCLLCCLEMLGKRNDFPPLQHFTNRKESSIPWIYCYQELTQALPPKDYGVWVALASENADPIIKAIRSGWCCVVGVANGGHAILVVDYDDAEDGNVEIIDPNDPNLNVSRMTKHDFNQWWCGHVIVIWKNPKS